MNTHEALKMAIEELHNALKLLKRFTPQSTGDGSWTAWTVGLKDQLSDLQHTLYNNGFVEGINACKEALEQPAQEPVAWIDDLDDSDVIPHAVKMELGCSQYSIPLYTHPHQWQGLTDDEIRKVYFELYDSGLPTMCFAHAIEQALKEKNT